MRISELRRQPLKSLAAFANLRPPFSSPQPMRFLSCPQQGLLLTLALSILLLHYARWSHPPSAAVPAEQPHEVVVEVSGEVHRPGIYIFKTPPSLKEALEKAGGIKNLDSVPQDLSSGGVETGTRIMIEKKNPDTVNVTLGRMEAGKLAVFSIPYVTANPREE